MNIPYLKAILLKFLDSSNVAVKVCVAVITFFAGIKMYLISIFTLLVLDFITGIWAAKKSGKEITSGRMKGTIQKSFLYMILMIAAMVLNDVFKSVVHSDTFYLVWLLTILINTYEITSVIENITKIYPDLAFLSRLSNLLNKATDKQFENAEDVLGVKPEDKQG